MKSDEEVYTNGLYVISAITLGSKRQKGKLRLIGHIVDINTTTKRVPGSNYRIGSYVNFPLYHTEKDNVPQFKSLSDIRDNKINTLLNGH